MFKHEYWGKTKHVPPASIQNCKTTIKEALMKQ